MPYTITARVVSSCPLASPSLNKLTDPIFAPALGSFTRFFDTFLHPTDIAVILTRRTTWRWSGPVRRRIKRRICTIFTSTGIRFKTTRIHLPYRTEKRIAIKIPPSINSNRIRLHIPACLRQVIPIEVVMRAGFPIPILPREPQVHLRYLDRGHRRPKRL